MDLWLRRQATEFEGGPVSKFTVSINRAMLVNHPKADYFETLPEAISCALNIKRAAKTGNDVFVWDCAAGIAVRRVEWCAPCGAAKAYQI